MALVPYRDPDSLPEEQRRIVRRPIHLYRALANEPEGTQSFYDFAEWVRWHCPLDARLREMLILYIGYLSRDPYEWSHHIVLGREFGVTDDDVSALIDHAERRESTLTDKEKLVLDATEQLTVDAYLDDMTWSALTTMFDDRELTDIVMVASFYCMVVRVLGGLRIDVEPEYQAALDRFPLPTREMTH